MSPKMLARSGLVGKNSSRPHLGPSLAIFCMGWKNRKNKEILPIFLGGPIGPIHPVWGNGFNISSAIHSSAKRHHGSNDVECSAIKVSSACSIRISMRKRCFPSLSHKWPQCQARPQPARLAIIPARPQVGFWVIFGFLWVIFSSGGV